MNESRENYLETIYMLGKRSGSVRKIDIAAELGFSKPSVSRAIKLLIEDGYVAEQQDGSVVLTGKGLKQAQAIYDRHCTLTAFLQRITAVSEEVAEQDACRMEHVISEEVFQGIKAFMKAEEELISTEEAQMLEAVRQIIKETVDFDGGEVLIAGEEEIISALEEITEGEDIVVEEGPGPRVYK